MSRRRTLMAGIACAVAVAVGCGSSSNGVAGASVTLSKEVAAVRAAAASHDPTGARLQLAQLRTTVKQLETQGQLSTSKAAGILAAASAVDTQLDTLTPPTTAATTTTTETTTTQAPAPSPDRGDHGHKNPKK